MKVVFKTKADPGFASRAFHTITRVRLLTEFPHAGIVVGDTLMHANRANGLHAVPFVDDGRWMCVTVPGDEQALALFEQHKGTPYDVFSLLAFIQPFSIRDGDRMYCYEWVWLVLTGEMPNFRVTPEMILVELISRFMDSTRSGYNNPQSSVNKDHQ